MATLIGILKAVETQLAATVTKLGATNIEIADSATGYSPRVSKYGAVIFGASLDFEGFAGGLEFKNVIINIAFIHVRDTDHSEDIKKIEMLLVELADQARAGLQVRFLSGAGALSEPLECVRQSDPFEEASSHVRVNQNWRCMYHHLLSDYL